MDMIKCTLHRVLCLPNILSLAKCFIFSNNCDITFITVFILTHLINIPCGRKGTLLFYSRCLTPDNFTHVKGRALVLNGLIFVVILI